LPLVRDDMVIETLEGNKVDKIEQVYTEAMTRAGEGPRRFKGPSGPRRGG